MDLTIGVGTNVLGMGGALWLVGLVGSMAWTIAYVAFGVALFIIGSLAYRRWRKGETLWSVLFRYGSTRQYRAGFAPPATAQDAMDQLLEEMNVTKKTAEGVLKRVESDVKGEYAVGVQMVKTATENLPMAITNVVSDVLVPRLTTAANAIVSNLTDANPDRTPAPVTSNADTTSQAITVRGVIINRIDKYTASVTDEVEKVTAAAVASELRTNILTANIDNLYNSGKDILPESPAPTLADFITAGCVRMAGVMLTTASIHNDAARVDALTHIIDAMSRSTADAAPAIAPATSTETEAAQ